MYVKKCLSHAEKQLWKWDAETFEAPKTMTKSQAEKKFIAIMKPYWLKGIERESWTKTLTQTILSHIR